MITILTLGPVKASEQKRATRAVTPQVLRENMTKAAGFCVSVNIWNISLQSGLKCKMNLFILFLLFNLNKHGKNINE